MVLDIVKYGNPILRQKGARIERVTLEIKTLIADMLETMYAAKGIGLAAQQVGRPLQLTVVDVRGATDRPSWLKIDGKEADLNHWLPLVLINPQVNPVGEPVAESEGCLSFPELYGHVARPRFAEVQSLNEKGQQVQFWCGGLLARAIQHENDHLKGILFIDRMSRLDKEELKKQLDQLQAATRACLKAAK